MVFLKYHIQD